MKSAAKTLRCLSVLYMACASVSSVYATGSTWDGGAINDPEWNVGANWTGNVIPGTTYDVTFATGFGSGTTIYLPSSGATANSLTISTVTGFQLDDYPQGYYSPSNLTITSGQIYRADVTGTEADQQIYSNIVLPTDGIFAVYGSGTLYMGSVNQVGATARSVTKTGPGRLSLAGSYATNPFTGPLYISGGTVAVGESYGSVPMTNPVAIYSGNTMEVGNDCSFSNVTFAGSGVGGVGAIMASNPGTLSGSMVMSAAATVNSTNTYLGFSGNLSDGGNHYTLTKIGSGRLGLRGNNSAFTGSISLSAGEIVVGSSTALGSAATAFTVPSGTGLGIINNVVLSRATTISGSGVSGYGALFGTGYGTSTYAGSLVLGNNATLGTDDPNCTLVVSGTIADGAFTYGLNIAGTGTVILAGSNTFDGDTTLSSGTLRIDNAAALFRGGLLVKSNATNNPTLVINNVRLPNNVTFNGNVANGTYDVMGTSSTSMAGNITLAGTRIQVYTSAATDTLTISGPISDGAGSAGIIKSGAGRLVLTSNSSSFDGATTALSGTLTVSSSNALGTAGALIDNDATLELSNGSSVNRPLTLSPGTASPSTGSLRATTGDNTWAGNIALSGITVNVGADANASVTLAGPISGNTPLIKVGNGRLFLSGAANYSTLSVVGGRAAAIANTAVPSTLAISATSGGSFELQNNVTALSPLSIAGNGFQLTGALRSPAGSNIYNGAITLAGDAAMGVDAGSTLAVNGIVFDAGDGFALSKVGSGTLLLNNSNNYSGGTNINGGTLKISSDAALGATYAPVTINNAAKLEFSAGVFTSRLINANLGTLQADPGVTVLYFNSTVTGGFLRGGGTHNFTTGSTFIATTVSTGSVINQNGSSSLSNFSNGGTFVNNYPLTWDGGTNSGSGTFNVNSTVAVNNFENDGVVNIANGGVLANSATSLYSGGGSRITINPGGQVTLSGGTSLELNGSLLTNNGVIIAGVVNVNYGSLATGTGTYGTVVVNTGGTFQPGAGPVGTPSVQSPVGLINSTPGTFTATNAVKLAADTVATVSASSDTLTLAGPLTASGVSITKNGSGTLNVPGLWANALYVNSGITGINTGSGVSVLNGLSISAGATFDLRDNDLILNYFGTSPVDSIRSQLAKGFNGGSWNGAGITSSAAAGDTGFRTALGYVEASQLGLASGGLFDGQSIPGQALLVKYTYCGDDDLDGKVTLNDFSIFVDGFNGLGSGWVYGDYDYNGIVDLNDLAMFVGVYKDQGPVLSLRNAILSDSELSLAQRQAMLSVVPEPAALIVLPGAMVLLAGCRRKRRA